MSLSRARKELIPCTLTITGQGDTATINLTYFNRKTSEVNAKLEEVTKAATAEGGDGLIAQPILLWMVKEWDCEYPLTAEGLTELEDDRPGVIVAVVQGFHDARRMAKEKN